jgi:hypothetical protein
MGNLGYVLRRLSQGERRSWFPKLDHKRSQQWRGYWGLSTIYTASSFGGIPPHGTVGNVGYCREGFDEDREDDSHGDQDCEDQRLAVIAAGLLLARNLMGLVISEPVRIVAVSTALPN